MKIVLTGASSFTGYWFARALFEAGAQVLMPLQSQIESYGGVRAQRVQGLAAFGKLMPSIALGSTSFLDLISGQNVDLLCHHAAVVGNHRSPSYNIIDAVSRNTAGVQQLVDVLAQNGTALLITGSVFEAEEGSGEQPLRAFSPYGLSKSLSAQIFEYYCYTAGVHLGKFVIANPFGILEEARFCNFLVRTWAEGKCAQVKTPLYVRDNIHVDLLARAYADFALSLIKGHGPTHLGPSGYVESQGAFAKRFAREIGERLNIRTDLDLVEQIVFDEPVTRINTDRLDSVRLGWSERIAWDRLANYYAQLVGLEG